MSGMGVAYQICESITYCTKKRPQNRIWPQREIDDKATTPAMNEHLSFNILSSALRGSESHPSIL